METTRRALGGWCILPALALCLSSCGDPHGPRSSNATTSPASVERVAAFDPTAPVELEALGTPVRSSRVWSSALAPNNRGGWNFIIHSYELHSQDPSEFVVVDLQTGIYSIMDTASRTYSNSNFKIANQLRAANGRIFFPLANAEMAYYDPADESVKEMGGILASRGDNNILYQAVFGPDGKLYGSTQSNRLPAVVQIDTDTLQSRLLGEVGQNRNGYSYGYDLAVDPPWVYVTVGESPWELAALNIKTGESKVLATRTDNAWMKLETRPGGIIARLITGLRTPHPKEDIVWCIDGATVPFQPQSSPARLPFKPHNVQPVTNPLEAPPELDLSAVTPDSWGGGRISWRARGATTWNQARYRVKYTSPVDIESLFALPDGTLLGSTTQYHGFFRYNPADGSTTPYGPHGASRVVLALMNSAVYIVGYPNGILHHFDPSKPWTANGADQTHDPKANPRWLGNFAQPSAHYPAALIPSDNGRLYYAGRRERVGVGGGVGYYEPTTNKYAGHYQNLSFLDPQGLVVLDRIKRVVYSGRLHDDPAQPGKTPSQAELVIYDADLNELERQIVKPELRDTGQIFPTADPSIIIGLVKGEHAIYRYDIAARKLLAWQPLAGTIGAVTQRSDRSLWIIVNYTLARIDPTTLAIDKVGSSGEIPADAEHLTWQGKDLYFTVHEQLYRIPHVGIR